MRRLPVALLALVLLSLAPAADAQGQTNQAPRCNAQMVTLTAENQSFQPVCWDNDYEPITFEIVEDAVHGDIVVDGSTFHFTNPEVSGWTVDRVVFRVSDGEATSPVYVIELGFNAVPRPVCDPQPTFVVRPGKTRYLSVYCISQDSVPLGYTLLDAADNVSTEASGFATSGSANLTGGQADGAGTMTYAATNSSGTSYPRSLDVLVSSTVNTLPECYDGSRSAPPGVKRTLGMSCGDAEGDLLTVRLTEPFTFGALSELDQPDYPGGLTTAKWTPPAVTEAQHGGFDFVASDGFGDSAPRRMSLTADPAAPNEAPWCQVYSPWMSTESGPVAIHPNCYDDDEFTYALVADSAVNGTAAGPFESEYGGTYFTFDGDAPGDASFQFSVSDGAATRIVTVPLTVSAPPAPNCSQPAPLPVRSGKTKYTSIYCTYADSVSLVEGSVTHGTVSQFFGGGGASFYFTAESGFTGTGEVTVRATNAHGTTDVTVQFQISPDVNSKPSCGGPGNVSVRVGGSRTMSFFCSDADGDPYTLAAGTAPQHGSVSEIVSSFSFGSVKYTAPATTEQPLPLADDFTLTVDDDRPGDGTPVPFGITVQPQTYNQPPGNCWSGGGSSGVYSGQAAYLNVTCNDPDGDPLTYSVASQGLHGTVSKNGLSDSSSTFMYTSEAGYTGPDSFTVDVSDGTATVAVPVNFTVTEPPAPVCGTPPVRRVRPGQTKGVTAPCSLASNPMPGFGITFEIVDPPDHGTLAEGGVGMPMPGAQWSYTADADDGTGDTTFTDSFQYTASANGHTVGPITQQIEVDPTANEEPWCSGPMMMNPVVRTSATKPMSVSCYDPDGDFVEITTNDPAHGSIVDLVTDDDGMIHFSYDPDAGFVGTDTVSWNGDDGYEDGAAGNPSGQIGVTVVSDESNVAPSCSTMGPSLPFGPRAGGRYRIYVSCSDYEGDPVTISTSDAVNSTVVETVPVEQSGPYSTPAFYVTVEGGSEGPGSFDVTPHDGREAGQPATYGFTVRAADANEAPSCFMWPPFEIHVPANEPFDMGVFEGACHDADQDELQWTVAVQPVHGELTGDPIEGLTYTPDPNYSGHDEITFHLTDGRVAEPLVQKLQLFVDPPDETFDTLITDGPDHATRDTVATFEFSSPGHPDAAFECRLDEGAWEACASGDSVDGLADGDHVMEVRAVQGDAIDATPDAWHWEVDTAAPSTPVITEGPDEFVKVQTATLHFTGDEDADFECRRDGAGEFSPCVSGSTLAGFAEGAHELEVVAVDAAGNSSAPASHAWTVDLTAPDGSIDAKPPALTKSGTSEFAYGADEPGVTFLCSLDGGPQTACPASIGLADGEHTLSVVAVDRAGNEDPTPATWTWTVDTTAPATPGVTGGPEAVTSSQSATFAFASEGAASYLCRIGKSGDYSACTSPKEYTGLAEGEQMFSVIALDAAGNQSDPADRLWYVDRTGPDAPVLDSKPAAFSNSTTALFDFTTSGAQGVECRLDDGAFVPCDTGVSEEYTGLAEGPHSFAVRAYDGIGNRGPETEYGWTVDTTAPAKPAIGTKPPPLTRSRTAEFTFSGDGGYQCRLTPAGEFSACESPKTYTELADGTRTFSVRSVDAAGNVSPADSYTWVILNVAPPVPTLIDKPASSTKAQTARFEFASAGADSFECRRGAAGEFEACASPVDLGGLTEGQHTFAVRALDTIGNVSEPVVHTWDVDLTAPAAPVIGDAPAALTKSSSATVAFTGQGAASFECKLDGGEYAECASPEELTGLGDGEHTFAVRALDAAGNAGDADTHTWTVDTVAPQTTLVSGPSGETDALVASFAFTGAGAFECKLDGGDWAACSSPKVLTGLSVAAHTFAVRAVDAAGNADATPAERAWTVVALPPAVETTTGEVPATGGNVSTAPAGTAPTAAEPVVLAIDVPPTASGGTVSIETSPAPTGNPPSGYGFLGQEIQIEAPDATAENPLKLTFDVDAATLLAHGLTVETVEVFRDQVAIPACTGPAGQAIPEVCVSERTALEGGDARLVVLSTHASTWNLGKDAKAPETTIKSGPEGTVSATDATFELGSDDAAATFECSVDGGAFEACGATKALSGLAAGEHTLKARARDRTGNVDDTPAARTWTVAAPATPAEPVKPAEPAKPGPDTTPPVLSLGAARQKLKAVLAKGLRIDAGCDEACTIDVTVTIDAKTARKLKLGRKAVRAGAAATDRSGTVTVRLTRKVAAKLKKARSVVLTVSAVAEDAAGNGSARTIKVTLKR